VHDAIPLRASGTIEVTVTGDARAAASSAQAAFAVTNPNIIAATAALPEPGEAVLVNAGDTTAASLDTTIAPAAGDYHLTFVCVGTGQVRVKLFDAA
jgi:hypothetical protein